MRPLLLLLLVLCLPGCLLSRMTYRAMAKPNRPHVIEVLEACSVRDQGDKVEASLVFRLEGGGYWLLDPKTSGGSMSARRGKSRRHRQFLSGALSQNPYPLPGATRPCVWSTAHYPKYGSPVRVAGPDGRFGAPRPLTADQARDAAVIIHRSKPGGMRFNSMRLAIPPPGGRVDLPGGVRFNNDILLVDSISYLAPPLNPADGGKIGFVFVAPFTGIVDLISAPIQLVILLIAWS